MLFNYEFILEAHKLGIKKDFFEDLEYDTELVFEEIFINDYDFYELIDVSKSLALSLFDFIMTNHDDLISNDFGTLDLPEALDLNKLLLYCWNKAGNKKYELPYYDLDVMYNVIGREEWYQIITSSNLTNYMPVDNWHPEYLAYTNFLAPRETYPIFIKYYEDLVELFTHKGIPPYIILELLQETNYSQFFTDNQILSVITRMRGEDKIYCDDNIFKDVKLNSYDDISTPVKDCRVNNPLRPKHIRLIEVCKVFLLFLDVDNDVKNQINTSEKLFNTIIKRAKILSDDPYAKKYKIDFTLISNYLKDEIKNGNAFEKHKNNIHKFLKYYNKL